MSNSPQQQLTPDQILDASELKFSGFHPQALEILMSEMEKLQAYGDPKKLDALLKGLENPDNTIADLIGKLKGLNESGAYDQTAIESLIKLKERILNVILLQTIRIGRNANEMTRDGAIDPMESNALQIQYGVLKFMLSFMFKQYSERQIIVAMQKLQSNIRELNISDDIIPFTPLMLEAVLANVDKQIKFFGNPNKVALLNKQVKEAGTRAYRNDIKSRKRLGVGAYDPDANIMISYLMSPQFKAADPENYIVFRPMTALVIASDENIDNDQEIIKIMPEIQRDLESNGKESGGRDLSTFKAYLRENIHEKIPYPKIATLPIILAIVFFYYLTASSGPDIELGKVYKRELFTNKQGKSMTNEEIREYLEKNGIVEDIKDKYGVQILNYYSRKLDSDKVAIPSKKQIEEAITKLQGDGE